MPDLGRLEAQYEEAFAAALAMTDVAEPLWVLNAWGTVMVSAVMLDRARKMAAGETPSPDDAHAAGERVLERWQQLRPDSGGPALFRTFRIQDPGEKQTAAIALSDRFPDDALVVWQATSALLQRREVDRATEIAETFLARNPEHPVGHLLLAHTAGGNETHLADVLQRWAQADPGHPALVSRWMGSSLPRLEPAATRRVLGEFFARLPDGPDGLTACLQVLRADRSGEFADPARVCVARVAADPAAPAQVAERATSAMAEIAAQEGDWSAVLTALDTLEPEARVRALLGAARRLETPERCGEQIELLGAAFDALVGDESGYESIAAALRACAERSAAQSLFSNLLRRAPVERLDDVVGRWVVKVNDVYRGEVPAEAAGVLEERLRQEGDAEGLLAALYLVYELADPGDRQFEILRRWSRVATFSLRGEQAIELAWGLVERGDPAAAAEALERQLERRFEFEVAETAWQLHLDTDGAAGAERFAEELTGAGDRWRSRAGHWLAARSALLRQDLAGAERHYWSALEGESPDRRVAVELLATVGLRAAGAGEAAARRICSQTALAAGPKEVISCAAELLALAGDRRAAADLLAARGADLPRDSKSLRELAAAAATAGEAEVAERALRRIVELDPRSENGWIDLARFLERRRRVGELESLLHDARSRFDPPPSELFRASGRALVAAGRPREAVDVLLEARRSLPETGGEWSRGWIDRELGQAYRALGARAPGDGPRPRAALEPFAPESLGGTPSQLRRAADELQSGREGRYDPEAAELLYARAAEDGDPLASFRLALVRRLASPRAAVAATASAEELYGRSATAVERLATEGDGYAAYLVGTAALIGLGGPEDFAAARRWLERAAEAGEEWAWHNLAWMAETGRGFDAPDPAAALDAYRRAAEAGNTRSMVDVARLTLVPWASGPVCDEGVAWLERAARAGNAAAAADLGKIRLYGRGECVTSDPVAAMGWLEAAAATHQPGATYDLALALLLTGVDATERERGLALLEGEAGRSDGLVLETLAFLRASGVGAPRDPAEARRLESAAAALGSDGLVHLRRAFGVSEVFDDLLGRGIERLEALSGEGDASAAAWLARLHAAGLGEGVDAARTASLAQSAAEAGETIAMRLLSRLYERGEGVETDPAQSRAWLRRCAEAGDPSCMRSHGLALIGGEDTRQLDAGLAWLRRSAEAGNRWAMSDLGRLYDEGRHGVAPDERQALAWRRRAAELGDAEARGWLLYRGDG